MRSKSDAGFKLEEVWVKGACVRHGREGLTSPPTRSEVSCGQTEKQKVEGDQQQTAEEKLHTLRSWEEALATGFAGKPLKRLPRETASLKNLSQPENTEPGTRVRGQARSS